MQPPLVVPLTPKSTGTRTSRSGARARAVFVWIIASILSFGPLAGAQALRQGDPEGIAIMIIPTIMALTLFWAGRTWWRAASAAEGEHFTMGADHAFTVDADRIDFPATGVAEPESWPLLGTSVRVADSLGLELLVLRWGEKKRSFVQSQLLRPIPDVVRDLVARQEDWRRNPGWPTMQVPALAAGAPGPVQWTRPGVGSVPQELQDPRPDGIGGGLRQHGESGLQQ